MIMRARYVLPDALPPQMNKVFMNLTALPVMPKDNGRAISRNRPRKPDRCGISYTCSRSPIVHAALTLHHVHAKQPEWRFIGAVNPP